MCTLGSERISRPKRQIIERPDSLIPLAMMCTFFSVRSAHIFNSSLVYQITFKKNFGCFFFRKKIDKRKKIAIQCQIMIHFIKLMISTWDIPKHDFWGKNTFFKNAFSF